jgi:PAS domain S-box-containing protein
MKNNGLKKFLTIFFFLSLLTLLVGLIMMYHNHQKKLEFQKENAIHSTKLLNRLIIGSFNTIISDLLLNANDAILLKYLNSPDDSLRRHIAADYQHFLEQKHIYDQIRFISKDGQEIIRVNFNNGKPVIIPREKLQNKSDRYYFKNILGQKKNEIYISPFDLNIEAGQIEIPYKPIIRVGTSVFNSNGEMAGMVIVNFLGAQMIRDFRNISKQMPGINYLINENGYWLITEPEKPELEWAFMFSGKQNISFKSQYPLLWDIISKKEHGQFVDDNGLFTFSTISLPKLYIKQCSLADFFNSDSACENHEKWWKITNLLPTEFAKGGAFKLSTQFIIENWIIFLIIAFISLIFTRVILARDRSKYELVKLSRAVEQSLSSVIITNHNGTIEYVNPAFLELTGYTSDEVIGKNPNILQAGPQSKEYFMELWQTISNGRVWQGEFHNRKKNGELFWESGTISPIKDEKNNITHYVAVKDDITAKRLYEKELKRLASFPEDNPNMVIEIDSKGQITYLNPAAKNYFSKDKIEHAIQLLISDILCNIAKIKHEPSSKFEEIIVGGLTFERRVKFFPEYDNIRVYAIDITRRKRMENDLVRARETADAANRLKSDFLANMSHEIRTPMNAIVGYSDMLLIDEVESSKREKLEIISNSCKHLLNLINDILDFSKIEADRMVLRKEVFSISQLLSQVQDLFFISASEKKLDFGVIIPKPLPPALEGDSYRLNQILVNLVGNSLKFTESGAITVSALYHEGKLILKVSDTGIGITEDKQKIIFAPFRQVDPASTRSYDGAGLGLTITRKLILMMGGTITVKSNLETGSVFTVEIPMPEVDEDKLDENSIIKEKKNFQIMTKWLALEKNSISMREYVLGLIKTLPGKMEKLEKAVDNKKINDIDFISHELKGTAANLGMTEIHEPAKLLNDFSREKIIRCDMISQTMSQLQQIINSIPEKYFKIDLNKKTGKKVQSDFKVLIAEDNKINQQVMKEILGKVNVKTYIADNGKIAIDMLKEKTYDLLLLDMQMPVMGGMEAISIIRKTEELKNIYTIALTADAMEGDSDRFINAGCNDYLAKPVKVQVLFDKINMLIEEKNSRVIDDSLHEKSSAENTVIVKISPDKRKKIDFVIKGLKDNIKIFQPAKVVELAETLIEINELTELKIISRELINAAEEFNDETLEQLIEQLETLIRN